MSNFFKDNSGKVIIAQKPNLPIKVWFIAFIISKLPLGELIYDISSLVAFGAIFTWAWMEIFGGVNLLRRTLGVLVMLFIILIRI